MLTAAIIQNHPIHYTNLLFRELRRRGVEFEVLFAGLSSAERLECLPEGYPYRVCFPGDYERVPPLGAIRSVWAALTDLDPQVVILSGYCDVSLWTAWAWAEMHRRPKLLWAESNRGDYPRHWWKEQVKSLFVRRCAAANVYGESSRDYLVDLGMPGSRIAVRRTVLDTDLFSYCAPPAGERSGRLLLYVGRFSPEKNLEFLLRTFARLARDRTCPDVRLALVGYGPLEDRLRWLAKDLGLRNLVEFWGPAQPAELPALYRAADALVLPSFREAWGLVVLEAMACGLPVLVSNRCGCVRDVVNEDTGLTFDPASQESLLAAMRELVSRPPAVLERMGRAAALTASRYSPENCARLVIASLDSLVQRNPSLFPTPEWTGSASLR